jgi:hypothetical protein
MALSFPLTLGQFFTGLAKVSYSLRLDEAVLFSETAGGEVIPADYGPRLWRADVTIRANTYLTLDRVVAKVERIQQADATVNISHAWRIGPQADPNGTILGASTPQITNINANQRDVTIGGLPAAYVVTEGDFISFTYLSSPTRRAFHRIMNTVTANGGGVAGSVELSPSVRPGPSVPFNVELTNPLFRAVYIPGSYSPPTQSRAVRTEMSLSFRQTLR